ncbi:hypothetical protein [Burkholderia pseudomultivorans]|uniref:hypothetical protein n=1 Tax=Burkholderia pseudomultivorans TaxID=1207504 RepID=UPI000AC82FF4|nr:hypothetical protein [Burkholderia pseudomultivorans]
MSEKDSARFLDQFDVAKRSMGDWPEWMKNAAKIATASLPESRVSQNSEKVKANEKQKLVK